MFFPFFNRNLLSEPKIPANEQTDQFFPENAGEN